MIPTVFFWTHPTRYLVWEDTWPHPMDLDIRWAPDPYRGLGDIARHPESIIDRGRGDCVDYARYAASWVYHNTDLPVALYLCLNREIIDYGLEWPPIDVSPPAHLIVADTYGVYSLSGSERALKRFESVGRYLHRTDRRIAVRRRIRGAHWSRVVRPTAQQLRAVRV